MHERQAIDLQFDQALNRARVIARRKDGTVDRHKYGLLFVAAMLSAAKVYGTEATFQSAQRYIRR